MTKPKLGGLKWPEWAPDWCTAITEDDYPNGPSCLCWCVPVEYKKRQWRAVDGGDLNHAVCLFVPQVPSKWRPEWPDDMPFSQRIILNPNPIEYEP